MIRTGKQIRWNTILALVVTLVITACTSPYNQVGLQGRLLDSAGVPVNGNVSMQVVYWTCSAGTGIGCTREYTDTATIAVTNGLFNFPVGEATIPTGGGPDPSIYAQPLWAEITVNGETLSPRQPLTGSPFAMSLIGGAVIGSGHTTSGGSAVSVDYGTLTVAASGAGASNLVIFSASNGGDMIRACTVSSAPSSRTCGDVKFRVLADGNVRADGSFTPSGADFAERIEVDGAAARLQPGDVLVISDSKDRAVELATKPYSTAVLGVYSTQPGFLGGTAELHDNPNGTVPVAFVGIVPVKVTAANGPIHRGDLLTTSSVRGHAMLATEYVPGAILGKAMGELTSGTGVIEVALIVR